MRLPYLQVLQKAWATAKTLAGLLKRGPKFPESVRARREAMGLQLDLWALAIELGPEEAPPTGRIDSPRAAEILAAAMEYSGDPEVLATAFCDVGLLERTTTGLRVKGTDIYTTAFENREKDRARKAAGRATMSDRRPKEVPRTSAPAMSDNVGEPADGPRTAEGIQRMSGGNPADGPRTAEGIRSSDADADADASGGGGRLEVFDATGETAALPAAEEITSRARAGDKPDRDWKEAALWAAYGAEYAARGLYVERAKPKGWRAHVATAREQNFSLGQLVGALREFLEDSRPASEGGLRADTRSLALFFEPGIWGRRVKPDPTPDRRLEDLSPAAQAFAERLDRMAAEGASYGAAYLRQLEPVELREDGQLVVQGDKYQLSWFQGVYAEWADTLGLLVQLSPAAQAFAERLEKVWPTRDGTGA